MVQSRTVWFLITTTQHVVGRKKIYISPLTPASVTDKLVAPAPTRASEPSSAVVRNREVLEAYALRCATAAGGIHPQGEFMDSDEHRTEELGSLISHGIEDHYPLFWKNPLSYFIYMHLLFYAKHSGPEKGQYIFETREISNLMCFGRKETDENPSLHRSTVIKAIKHLAKIGMIKVLQRPTGKYSRLWKIEIEKYKTAWGDFRALFKAESPKSHVASSQPENGYTKSSVAISQPKTPEPTSIVTPLTRQQMEFFDDTHGAPATAEDATSLLSARDGKKSHNFNPELLLTLPKPTIALYFAVMGGLHKDNNIYTFFSSKREKYNKEVNRLLVLLEEESLDDFSSEELIKPEHAIAVTNALHQLVGDSNFNSSKVSHIDSTARGEFVRLYWNHIRYKGKSPFQKATVLGKKRQDKLKNIFVRSNYFRDHWARALLRIRDSRNCRGSTARGWRANFDWFTRDETAVINAMEGRYDDRGETAGRIKRSFDEKTDKKDHLKGVPLSMVLPKDIEHWKRTNPQAAREATKQGLL